MSVVVSFVVTPIKNTTGTVMKNWNQTLKQKQQKFGANTKQALCHGIKKQCIIKDFSDTDVVDSLPHQHDYKNNYHLHIFKNSPIMCKPCISTWETILLYMYTYKNNFN